MRIRSISLIAILWVVSVVFAAVAAAQILPPSFRPVPEKVLSGEDLGFRVTGMVGEVPTGTLVIRVNGQWYDTTIQGQGVIRRGTD